MSRLMICSDCAKALEEVKTMGGFGPCSVCGQSKPDGVGGPISEAERNRLRAAYGAVWDSAFNTGVSDDFWRAQNPYREEPTLVRPEISDPSRDVAIAAIVQVLLPRLTPREVGLVVDRLNAWVRA